MGRGSVVSYAMIAGRKTLQSRRILWVVYLEILGLFQLVGMQGISRKQNIRELMSNHETYITPKRELKA